MSPGGSPQDETRPPRGTEEDGPAGTDRDPARHPGWEVGVGRGWELLRGDISLATLLRKSCMPGSH